MTREQAVHAIMGAGKSREQAEAYLALVKSAFSRRGWVDGTPMSPERIEVNLATFLGDVVDGIEDPK